MNTCEHLRRRDTNLIAFKRSQIDAAYFTSVENLQINVTSAPGQSHQARITPWTMEGKLLFSNDL